MTIITQCQMCGKFPFFHGCKTESGSYHKSQFCCCNDTVSTVPIGFSPQDWGDIRKDLVIECIDGKLKCPFTQSACIVNDTAAFSSCSICYNNPHIAQSGISIIY